MTTAALLQGHQRGGVRGVGAMAWAIEITEEAMLDLRAFRKHEQQIILSGIEEQLGTEPARETRNRKPLRPNDLSVWEIRLGRYRVFYDVAGECMTVTVKAIGWKQHDALFIRGKEFQL